MFAVLLTNFIRQAIIRIGNFLKKGSAAAISEIRSVLLTFSLRFKEMEMETKEVEEFAKIEVPEGLEEKEYKDEDPVGAREPDEYNIKQAHGS